MFAAHVLRWIVRTSAVVSAVVLGGALLAGTHLTASAAGGTATGPFSLTLKAGGFDEICLRIEAGAQIDYRFRAEAEVDFNIHHHRGREVLYPVRQSAVRAVEPARFSPTTSEDYCLMWENRGAVPVHIEGRVEYRR